MDKIDVNGDNEDPVYTYLKAQKKSLMLSRIKWNFEKFLIARDGHVYSRYASTTGPQSISKDIEKLLKAAPGVKLEEPEAPEVDVTTVDADAAAVTGLPSVQ